MNTDIHATFQPLIFSTGAQKSKTVTIESGIAANCIKGMRLPLLFLLLSDIEAISGSVTASNTLERAVIRPKTVKNPPMTSPGVMYWSAPFSLISACVGR